MRGPAAHRGVQRRRGGSDSAPPPRAAEQTPAGFRGHHAHEGSRHAYVLIPKNRLKQRERLPAKGNTGCMRNPGRSHRKRRSREFPGCRQGLALVPYGGRNWLPRVSAMQMQSRLPVQNNYSVSMKGFYRNTSTTQTLLGLPMEDPDPALEISEGFWGLKTWKFESPKSFPELVAWKAARSPPDSPGCPR